MPGIQLTALSDEEFVHHMMLMLEQKGALPKPEASELLYRAERGGRDEEREAALNNPDQLNLPL